MMKPEHYKYPIAPTSLAAFAAVLPKFATYKGQILNAIIEHNSTCEELERRLTLPHTTVSAALTWLQDRGLIIWDGTTRLTKSKNPAQSYRMALPGEVVRPKKLSRQQLAQRIADMQEAMSQIVSASTADGGFYERLARCNAIAAKFAA